MANDLAVVTAAQRAISSPGLQRLRRISLGTIHWPGQPTQRYLAGGLKLTESERADAEAMRKAMLDVCHEGPAQQAEKARFALITNMLLAYPIAGASAETGRARGEAYREALAGVPAWAVSEAIKRWHRGECGEQHDYRWAPAPAVLRQAAVSMLAPYQDAAADLKALLDARPLDEVMPQASIDPTERERVSDGFKDLGRQLRGMIPPEDAQPTPPAAAEEAA